MSHQESLVSATAPASLIVTALLLCNPSLAEEFPFRVSFENVPGVEKIEAGFIPAGIKELEDLLSQTDEGQSGDILATLCAAYIVNASLDEAQYACNKAVRIDPTETAHNNRGVYRAFTGDISGAREDFERARPQHMEVYLEELRTKDARLVAADNFHLVDKLSARYTSADINPSFSVSTAAVENPYD